MSRSTQLLPGSVLILPSSDGQDTLLMKVEGVDNQGRVLAREIDSSTNPFSVSGQLSADHHFDNPDPRRGLEAV